MKKRPILRLGIGLLMIGSDVFFHILGITHFCTPIILGVLMAGQAIYQIDKDISTAVG